MHNGLLIAWIVETIIIGVVFFLLQMPIRKRNAFIIRLILFIVKLFLIPVTALLFVAIESVFVYRHGEIFVALYVILVGDIISGILESVISLVTKITGKKKDEISYNVKRHAILFTCISCIFFLFGYINANQYVEKKHTWVVDDIAKPHTFAFVADLHSGSARSVESLRELCKSINSANPEFVILGGDITDELSSYEEMTDTYRILSEIEAPVYFVYGNHDRQLEAEFAGGRTYSDEELADAINEAGIHILSDEFVKVSDDLVLLGREDLSAGDARKKWGDLNNPYADIPAIIVADHQPYDNEQLADEETDLQLSGHTHAGQLWPLQFIYRFFLKLPAFGEFKKPNTLLYVSSGASDWMLPFRTEERCEWDLITLIDS
ncbi:metallophosphoesterase [Butyrivibrio sp. JL13D10]|uniref:metallophosphoesterase n=1 Tax=Butyrivibrio sp. JL13D10 TaxID=3236815 RepID=UPI0038B5071C